MPNHAHVLFNAGKDQSLSAIVQSWKGFTARKINQMEGTSGPVWQSDYFDRLIRSREHLARVVCYMADNPREAGLAEGEFIFWRNKKLELQHGFRWNE